LRTAFTIWEQRLSPRFVKSSPTDLVRVRDTGKVKVKS